VFRQYDDGMFLPLTRCQYHFPPFPFRNMVLRLTSPHPAPPMCGALPYCSLVHDTTFTSHSRSSEHNLRVGDR